MGGYGAKILGILARLAVGYGGASETLPLHEKTDWNLKSPELGFYNVGLLYVAGKASL